MAYRVAESSAKIGLVFCPLVPPVPKVAEILPPVSEMEFAQSILNVPVFRPAFALKFALIVTCASPFGTTLNGVVEAGEKNPDPLTIEVRHPVAGLMPEF